MEMKEDHLVLEAGVYVVRQIVKPHLLLLAGGEVDIWTIVWDSCCDWGRE